MSFMSMFFGGDGGESRRQQKENTIQAGGIVGDSIAAYGTNRERIATQFAGNLSSARAKMGASGASAEGAAWHGIKRGLVRGRNEALSSVQAEEDVFRQGTAFKLVREDFERMGTVNKWSSLSYSSRMSNPDGTQRINAESSLTGESYMTTAQQAMLRTGVREDRKGFEEYAESLRPSFKEYEKYRFGSSQDKAAFSDSMTARIEASNLKYDRHVKMREAEAFAGNKFNSRGRN